MNQQSRFPTCVQPIFQNDDVYTYKLRDNLYLFHTVEGVPVSVYLIEGEESALVIDTGHVIKNLTEAIRKVTQKPLILALSHGHHDHIGSINEFDMNKGDESMIHDYHGKINFIQPGYIFHLGNLDVTVLEMYGHTPGSIGFLDTKNKYIVSGDAVGHKVVWMHISKLPLESLLGVLRHLLSIKGQWNEIYTGHYNQSNGPLGHQYIQDLLNLTQKICHTQGYKAEPFNFGPPVDFQPMIAYGDNGVGVVFNPARLHYL